MEKKFALCHPDKQHRALGLCNSCYQNHKYFKNHKRQFFKRPLTEAELNPKKIINVPDCHPGRKYFAKGFCRLCYLKNQQRKVRLTVRYNTEGSHTPKEWKDLLKKYPACPCCKTPWSATLNPTKDHIQPVSKGGTDFISNIQPLCQPCNSRKNNYITIKY